MSYECEFCKKSYSTLYTLKTHQQSTKFCLNIQENKNKDIMEKSNTKNFSCEFCNKYFSTKFNLQVHLKVCRKKTIIESSIISSEEVTKSNVNDIQENLKYIKELEIIKVKQETLILSKEELISELKNENNKLKNENKELINKYEELLKNIYKEAKNDYKEESKENKKNILEKNKSKVTVNNNYTVQFNNMFEKLEPFTTQNVKNKIDKIPCKSFVNTPDLIEDAFVGTFIEYMKDFTFCTDPSRGALILKLEDGKKKKVNSEKFILDCFNFGKDNLIEIISKANEYVESRKDLFSDLDHIEIIGKLMFLIESVRKSNCGGLVTTASNKLIKFCPQISKSTLLTETNLTSN